MISVNQLLRLLGPETCRQLQCYKGERPIAVLQRAMRMLAMADGHLTPNGRVIVARRQKG